MFPTGLSGINWLKCVHPQTLIAFSEVALMVSRNVKLVLPPQTFTDLNIPQCMTGTFSTDTYILHTPFNLASTGQIFPTGDVRLSTENDGFVI